MPLSELDMHGFQLDLDQLEAEFQDGSPSFHDATPNTRALDDLCAELDWIAPGTPTPRNGPSRQVPGPSLLAQAAHTASTASAGPSFAQTDWRKVRRLGLGSAGETWLVKREQGSAVFAMKEIARTRLYSDDELQCEDPTSQPVSRSAHEEVEILAKVKHPHVVSYLGSFTRERSLFILMEFCSGGDLQAVIRTHKGAGLQVEGRKVSTWINQVLLALQHCHSVCVLHRDLKPANIFLTRQGDAKLGDFGISCVLRNTASLASTHCGTPCYYSPERCRGEHYGTPSDVWALGCVLFELLALERAFKAESLRDLVAAVLDNPAPLHLLPPEGPPETREAVRMMLEQDPESRASVDELLVHLAGGSS